MYFTHMLWLLYTAEVIARVFDAFVVRLERYADSAITTIIRCGTVDDIHAFGHGTNGWKTIRTVSRMRVDQLTK